MTLRATPYTYMRNDLREIGQNVILFPFTFLYFLDGLQTAYILNCKNVSDY